MRAEKTAAKANAARKALERNQARAPELEQKLVDSAARQKHLEAQRTIRQLDVAQDTILTAAKLTAMQLITFVLRIYMTAMAMTPETFVSRVFPMRGRKEVEPTVERIIFYENPCDPDVDKALHAACCALNERDLQREGRRLRYVVEAAPAPDRSD